MIKQVIIRGFKCFFNETIDFKPLTVITGPNSSGKSSLIQAILINLSRINHINPSSELELYLQNLGGFIDLKNKTQNPSSYEIDICFITNDCIKYIRDLHISKVDVIYNSNDTSLHTMEYLRNIINVHYLSANRAPIKDFAPENTSSEIQNCGIYGQFIEQYYYLNKTEVIAEELRHKSVYNGNTLEAHVYYWLSYICDIKDLSLDVERLPANRYRTYYKLGTQEYTPQNLGSGVSYLIAILTHALLMHKQKDVFIIENPEIHLHPLSQARLGEFFAFVANTGRQIIIETHSEHLISKLRYCVYKDVLQSTDVIIHYRTTNQRFEKIEILENGKILNEDNEHCFPFGFFDATLDDIFEINSNAKS